MKGNRYSYRLELCQWTLSMVAQWKEASTNVDTMAHAQDFQSPRETRARLYFARRLGIVSTVTGKGICKQITLRAC
jgi:hypothetical protein